MRKALKKNKENPSKHNDAVKELGI